MDKIIAVDFDGTLCKDAWPGIGEPNWSLICFLQDSQLEGAKVILWTCRDGVMLDNAIEWCKNQGLYFDAVNDNLPESIKKFGSNSRKIFADVYIDDKATDWKF